MEEELAKNKKPINKYKVSTIILAIWVGILMINFFAVKINNNKVEIKFTQNYNLENSLYNYCELEILCKTDKIMNVNDFTFIRNGENVCVSKIEIGDKIYNSSENFTIKKYEKTKIKLYITLIEENKINTIYYNFKPINLRETKTI